MKKIKFISAIFAFTVLGGFALAPAGSVAAYDPFATACSGNSSSPVCQSNSSNGATNLIKTIVNTLLFVVGVLAVIMIIVAGISYTTSAGDASKITRAKNTLTYAIVGLVIAFLAFAIVNWVLKIFK